MNSLFFSKLIPGGNPTIILHEPDIKEGALGGVAARIMDPMHLQAEQAGALYANGMELPLLEMMGGEFCVNATRAAAFLLAGMGRLRQLSLPEATNDAEESALPAREPQGGRAWTGRMRVSGMPEALDLLVCSDEKLLRHCFVNRQAVFYEQTDGCAARQGPQGAFHWPDFMPSLLFCAARTDCSPSAVSCRDMEEGVSLVSMPGMQHILVDADLHPMPDVEGGEWRKAAAAWRKKCGIAGLPASGVVWRRKRQGRYHIWPAVEVLASSSEHLESACGSASLALALSLRKTEGGSDPLMEIAQPSGQSLLVFLEREENAPPSAAWVAGPVRLAAQGRVFL